MSTTGVQGPALHPHLDLRQAPPSRRRRPLGSPEATPMPAIDSIPVTSITEQHLLDLVAARVPEGKTIEYKRELKVGNDSEKREFCVDLTSFANAAGGLMLFGIRAEKGEAAEIGGLDIPDIDAQITTLGQIINWGISPRLPWFDVQPKRPIPEIDGNHYRIDYEAQPVSETVRTQRLTQQSTFILIRTRSKGWSIADEEMIERYKGQFHNEHGFAWLKSGPSHKGLNPIFLETPKRIASLCFLYVVGLMVWTLIQRTVRKNLKEWKVGLPYHRNKPSDNITTRFFFELFPSVQTVPYSTPDGNERVQLVGITPILELACKALGTDVGVFNRM
jgi:hypothetical protein